MPEFTFTEIGIVLFALYVLVREVGNLVAWQWLRKKQASVSLSDISHELKDTRTAMQGVATDMRNIKKCVVRLELQLKLKGKT